MNRYFPGVEFPELEPPAAPQEAPTTHDAAVAKDEMAEYHALVMRMLDGVRNGESSIAPGMQLNGSGLLNAMERMRINPTRENILEFLSVARQDINNRFAQECERALMIESSFTHGDKNRQNKKFHYPNLRRVVVGS